MQITKKNLSDTKVELTIIADAELLADIKQGVLKSLSNEVSLSGFRKGHAPLNLVEKAVDQSLLQRNFLDEAINQMYTKAATEQRLRPVDQPEVDVTKFVPFTTLEITAKVEAVGDVSLPDYTKIKLEKPKVEVTRAEIDAVLNDLKTREAAKTEVKRPSKDGDQVTIDFSGTDTRTKQPVPGADGKDYPLILGSNNFIPGFEPRLIGLKAGKETTFDIIFPKDYNVASLQDKKVTFKVTVKKVESVTPSKLDDNFAGKVGPFKTMTELSEDIKKQLLAEKTNQNERDYENRLLKMIADKTKVSIPKSLIDSEIDRMEAEEKRNLVYRGQTWQEHLDADGVTEEEHHERQREQATSRVKTGLVLGEVAEKEEIKVSADELELRMKLLKGQYTDKQMQAELNKPEARQDILNRLVTEKTIAVLVGYAS
ncbi:MAG: trigger factor [Candidatus Saccharimonadales bacterium]